MSMSLLQRRQAPVTPRTRTRPYEMTSSPSSTPSISSSIPFDWDAARARKPPPFNTPQKRNIPGHSATPRRFVRKQGFFERINNIPQRIAFEIALFPHNIPLPAPRTSAWLIGGCAHFLHLYLRLAQLRTVSDADLAWEDLYREHERSAWFDFDWTYPTTIFLLLASILNALFLFTRTRLYRMHGRHDPVSSPHATFVSADIDRDPPLPPSALSRILSALSYAFSCSWRFLLGFSSPASRSSPAGVNARVLQLDVWTPGPLERRLFAVYSPAHSLLWTVASPANWIFLSFAMVLVSVQMNFLTHSYELLLKDKEIVQAEVMAEYNHGFVYPRLNPIRKDVAVMTHQSEVVNAWED